MRPRPRLPLTTRSTNVAASRPPLQEDRNDCIPSQAPAECNTRCPGVALGAFADYPPCSRRPRRPDARLPGHRRQRRRAPPPARPRRDSLPAQYFDFVRGATSGDLGVSSSATHRSPSSSRARIAPSFFLISYSVLLSLFFGVPLAIIAALRRNRFEDHLIRVSTTVGFAMPAFWIGLLLALVFAVHLGWFPSRATSLASRRHPKPHPPRGDDRALPHPAHPSGSCAHR